jgi:hypothetical protein
MATSITKRVTAAASADNTKRVATSGATSGGLGGDTWGGTWGDTWGNTWHNITAAGTAVPTLDVTKRVQAAASGGHTKRVTL